MVAAPKATLTIPPLRRNVAKNWCPVLMRDGGKYYNLKSASFELKADV
jgi:hypothetical protein